MTTCKLSKLIKESKWQCNINKIELNEMKDRQIFTTTNSVQVNNKPIISMNNGEGVQETVKPYKGKFIDFCSSRASSE